MITSENTLGKYVLLPGDFAFRGERLKRAQAPNRARRVDIWGHLGTQDPTAIKMEMEGVFFFIKPLFLFKCEFLLKLQ